MCTSCIYEIFIDILPNLIANLHTKSCLLSKTNELEHDKTNKMTCAPSEDSDQPGHLPSLISLRCLHEETMGHKLPTECTAKTLIRLCWWAQADLCLSWAHVSFCWFCRAVTQIFWPCDLDNIVYSLIISSWWGWSEDFGFSSHQHSVLWWNFASC